jgi:hypothetical protein
MDYELVLDGTANATYSTRINATKTAESPRQTARAFGKPLPD